MSEIKEVKSRVNNLEQVFASFMSQTEMAVVNLKAQMADFKDEMKEFKEEMRQDRKAFQQQLQHDTQKFREEIRLDTQKFREEVRQDTQKFREEVRQDTQKFREEIRQDMKEFKEEMRTDRKNLNLQWGHLANRMGTMAEDIAAPGVHGIVRKYFNLSIQRRMVNLYLEDPDDPETVREFDVVALAGPYLVICEIKAQAKSDHIQRFMELIENDVFKYFPEYQGKKLIPIFSSLSIPEHLVKKLTNANVLAMVMGEEHMELVNSAVVEKLLVHRS